MTDDEVDLLVDATHLMASKMGIVFPNDAGLVDIEDERLDPVEHAVHELAHAITLGLPLFAPPVWSANGSLTDRVGMAIKNLSSSEADWNEAMCFCVERVVLRELGIEVEDSALHHALWIQVNNNAVALDAFDSGEDHEETREAICRIPLIFNLYKERVHESIR